MAVADSKQILKKQALQIQCDLLRAGLAPGVTKCIWKPSNSIQWNGLVFEFQKRGILIMDHRLEHMREKVNNLLQNWPKVSFREVSQFLGQINFINLCILCCKELLR
jgi:hypothetical protein